MLNSRSESKAHRRLIAYSKDGATGWTEPKFHPDLVEPICMGSTVRLSKAPRDRNRILFANPDNLTRADGKEQPGVGRDRRNLAVRLSYDEGATWGVAKVLEPGLAGYSDLAVGRDGVIFCLYERGGREGSAFRTQALTLARFHLEWLTEGKDRLRAR
jgi:sialidase-1